MPEELREQVPLNKEMLGAMNVNIVTLEGYEADDILGTLARRSEEKEWMSRFFRETGICCSLPQIKS